MVGLGESLGKVPLRVHFASKRLIKAKCARSGTCNQSYFVNVELPVRGTIGERTMGLSIMPTDTMPGVLFSIRLCLRKKAAP
jgi:hypothetical protein